MAELKILNSVIEAGIDTPFEILHITDAHIDVDITSGASLGTSHFEAALDFAKSEGLFVVCTGDNFKGFSKANYSYAMEHIRGAKGIFIPGNHDFCTCPDNKDIEVPEKQGEYIEKWAQCYSADLYFDSVIINGVNFVSLLDIYYAISYGQLELLKKEAAKGYPVILCMHAPLAISDMAGYMLSHGKPCAYMIAPTEEILSKYSKERAEKQRASEQTLAAIEYIKNEPMIKAIIAGHIHESFDGYADCGTRQITTGRLFDGIVRRIRIV